MQRHLQSNGNHRPVERRAFHGCLHERGRQGEDPVHCEHQGPGIQGVFREALGAGSEEDSEEGEQRDQEGSQVGEKEGDCEIPEGDGGEEILCRCGRWKEPIEGRAR